MSNSANLTMTFNIFREDRRCGCICKIILKLINFAESFFPSLFQLSNNIRVLCVTRLVNKYMWIRLLSCYWSWKFILEYKTWINFFFFFFLLILLVKSWNWQLTGFSWCCTNGNVHAYFHCLFLVGFSVSKN